MLHGLQKLFGVLGGRAATRAGIAARPGRAHRGHRRRPHRPRPVYAARPRSSPAGRWPRPISLPTLRVKTVSSSFRSTNQGEPAVLFCFVFLYLASAGPRRLESGRAAAQGLIGGSRTTPRAAQQFMHGPARDRVGQVGRDSGQRLQDEAPLAKPGVRHFEVRAGGAQVRPSVRGRDRGSAALRSTVLIPAALGFDPHERREQRCRSAAQHLPTTAPLR